jgi:poly(A) polymerase
VGGCIRDILMGLTPKDFDVVTNATPEQIKSCFNNCRLIGRRFRLAHVMFGREVIEVATFRGHHQQPPVEANNKNNDSHHSDEGQLLRDNVYGTIEEDAQRRDFTINALYYSINGFYIRDFANGIKAIEARKVELIGDPESRYREDPVRMLRAIRFAAKLDMTIEEKTEQPLYELGSLLSNIPAARLFEESMKLTLSGKAEANYLLMRQYDLFRFMFPIPHEVLDDDPDSKQERLVRQVFINTDLRINADKRVTPAYIHAALLWYVVEKETKDQIENKGLTPYDASYVAMTEVLARHCRSISLPKRFSTVSRDIWQLQHRLDRRMGKRAFKLMEHPKFRAGYDFLLLRGEIEGGEIAELGDWWTAFINGNEDTRQQMSNQLAGSNYNANTPKYRSPTKNTGQSESSDGEAPRRRRRSNNRRRQRKPDNGATPSASNSTPTAKAGPQ